MIFLLAVQDKHHFGELCNFFRHLKQDIGIERGWGGGSEFVVKRFSQAPTTAIQIARDMSVPRRTADVARGRGAGGGGGKRLARQGTLITRHFAKLLITCCQETQKFILTKSNPMTS